VGHVTLFTPFRGLFFIVRLGLATDNLKAYTKFEVFIRAPYEYMKSGAKCKIELVWGT